MAYESIKSDPNPIVVDNTVSPPNTHGTAKIVYTKDSSQEIWEKMPGQGWDGPLDVFLWVDDNRKHAESKGRHTVDLRPGDRVRLWPLGRADILDLALEGKTATIEAIEQDFEERIYLAVTVDDDPGKDLGALRQPGHRFFFQPEEVELLP